MAILSDASVIAELIRSERELAKGEAISADELASAMGGSASRWRLSWRAVTYRLVTSPTVRRQLADSLPAPFAFAAFEFITGPLLESPWQVGKRLRGSLDGRLAARLGTYRVIYRVDDDDHTVTVLHVAHRDVAYC